MTHPLAYVSLPSAQLDAFTAVAEECHFSRAAERLCITQPALSTRVRELEVRLSCRLFSRGSEGVHLTSQGERLMRYCLAKNALEQEAVNQIAPKPTHGMAGTFRVAGYSSVFRSVLLPCLAPLLRKHPALRVDFGGREMRELIPMLERAAADFVVVDRRVERAGIEAVQIGTETLVEVESATYPTRAEVYLDHDVEDPTTMLFMRANDRTDTRLERHYYDEVYCLLDGVAQGLGRGVVSRHLLATYPGLRQLKSKATYPLPVYLHYHVQHTYSAAFVAIRDTLVRNAAAFLDQCAAGPIRRAPTVRKRARGKSAGR